MTHVEKAARLRKMLNQIGREYPVEEMVGPPAGAGIPGFESTGEEKQATDAVRKVLTGQPTDLSPEDVRGLEAIILPRGRPAAFIVDGNYDDLPDPWTKLNTAQVRTKLRSLFGSVGRIELPNSPQYPFGGTGFVVGRDLLMTNRHVAKLFTDGRGLPPRLRYTPGDAAIDFKREKGYDEDDRSGFLTVREVAMIHPYWDMALLRVDGLSPNHPPLSLSVRRPEDLANQDVVVVGYPARDDRNDLVMQDRIFQRTYNVKRLQPGKVRERRTIRSFETTVNAMTHDSSTLGGNSGSVLVDTSNYQVVGLHFAGLYLDANFAVPASELARDPRVVAAGVNFADRVPPTADYDAAWASAGASEQAPTSPPASTVFAATGGVATWTVPIQVSITLGTPALAGPSVSPPPPPTTPSPAVVENERPKFQTPIIHPDLESRTGFDPEFLDPDSPINLPTLTQTGKAAAVKLDDGSTEVKYHRFSLVMHKKRRLALFTAANLDWRPDSHQVNGRKPTRKELTGLEEGQQELWVTDPRLPASAQLPDVFFTKDDGAFDKGHLVRRDDVAWGESFDEMQKGNGDTYHTTNCSPQVAGFNRSANKDNWGDLENLIQKGTKAEKAILFCGPVLADDDPFFHGKDVHGQVSVQIPRRFWKVVVALGDDGPQAFGFVLEQDLSAVPTHEEFAVPAGWRRHMKRVGEIEGLLGGLVKLTQLKSIDAFDSDEGVRMRK